MAFCENCGKELVEGQACDCTLVQGLNSGAATWESMKNRMGIGDPERNATDVYERGMKIVPECIRANEKEIPVKQYNIAVLRNLLKFERAEGRMQITNKRVIFRAAGRSVRGRTTLQNEFAIDEIAGIEARRNYKFSFLYLIFAILIIASAPYIVFKSSTTSDMMSPSHVKEAREKESIAISQRIAAQEREQRAINARVKAQEREQRAINTRIEAQKREKENSQGGYSGYYYYYDKDYYKKQRIEAQNEEKKAIAERESAEREVPHAIEQREIAVKKEAEAIKKRESTENTWMVLMTLFGLVLGVGGLVPFFLFYQKFGLKLFILNFSIFGFALSLTASGSAIFYLFLGSSFIITLVCMFIYCFRPNLVISIVNKSGVAAAVDIRRETQLTMYTEKGIGFYEVIPTEETEGAIREVGAIIGDIQKLGDFGVEKWIKK